MAHLAAYLCVISQHFRRGTCRAALAGWRRRCLVFVGFAASTIYSDTFIHRNCSVVRFFYLALFGIIPRKVGEDFLRCKLCVVLSLEAEIKFKDLTDRASALFLRAGRELGWACGSRPHFQALRSPDLRGEIGGTLICY